MTPPFLIWTHGNDQRLCVSRYFYPRLIPSLLLQIRLLGLLWGLLLGLLVATSGKINAQEPDANSALATSTLLIGPAFLQPPVYRYLPGSKRTIIYPALLKKFAETDPLNGKGFKPETWDQYETSVEKQIAFFDPKTETRAVRDSNGVIQMAVIFTDTPVTATCILSPGFLQHFSAIFGPELLIAIPAQNKIYVFPKLANRLEAMAETIRDDYLISPMPASTELFELSKNGLHAVGSLNPDDDE